MRIISAVALSLAFGTAAQAGALLASDPSAMTPGTTDSCLVVNITAKPLTDVTVSIWKSGGTVPEVSQTYATVAPNSQAGFQSNALQGGIRFCTVTLKGSAKAIRGQFCNLTTNICSSLR